MDDELSFFLMGKTGEGKSATGNSILDRKEFKFSAKATSETKEVSSGYRNFLGSILLVVDGPGLEDTDMDRVEDRTIAARHIREALLKCSKGVDVFLLVIRFGGRFTEENRSTVKALKSLFGEKYMTHLIVIITHGDNFQNEMEDHDLSMNIHEWCEKQDGEFCQLYYECQRRVVLFNNREKESKKKEAQVQELVQLALYLKKKHGRYTSECFEAAERERQRLILELKAPQLNIEIQKQIGLLYADLCTLTASTPDSEKEKIKNGIAKVKTYIKKQDQGFGVLANMMKLLKQVEENFNNTNELHKLARELDDARKAKDLWHSIGTTFVQASGPLVAACPFVGVATLFSGTLASVVSGVYQSKEGRLKEKEKALNDKVKNMSL